MQGSQPESINDTSSAEDDKSDAIESEDEEVEVSRPRRQAATAAKPDKWQDRFRNSPAAEKIRSEAGQKVDGLINEEGQDVLWFG
jgi:hypothetical protein